MSCCIYLAAFRSRPKTASPRHKQRGCTRGVNMVASGAQATRSSAARYCLLDKWQRENALDTYEATFLERQTRLSAAFSALFQPSSPSSPRTTHVWNAERRAVNASYICVFFFFPSFYLDDNTLQNTFFPPFAFSFEFNIRFVTIHIGCDELTFKTGRILFLLHTNSAN